MEADRPRNLQILPQFGEGLSYLYIEHARVDRRDQAVAAWSADGIVPIPCAALAALLLGPGTSITHLAVRTLADHGCSILWTGEDAVRFYAGGTGETRQSRYLERQARLFSDPRSHLRTARRLYAMRFTGEDTSRLSLAQLRGREGARVRRAYRQASDATGVAWSGRSYRQDEWAASDPVNRALSAANACLYGICHAAIVSIGCSPGLGFIHVGKQLSFVYDIADLYKAELSIPIAFTAAAQGALDVSRSARHAAREAFREANLLERVVTDLRSLLDADCGDDDCDTRAASPGGLWDPGSGPVSGGQNYAEEGTQ